ncbi:hypothetical protein, partial [Pseudomonas aeruginosa]
MPAIQIKSPALTLKAGRRALARIRERGLQPVSYTHLRAHETLMNLVC